MFQTPKNQKSQAINKQPYKNKRVHKECINSYDKLWQQVIQRKIVKDAIDNVHEILNFMQKEQPKECNVINEQEQKYGQEQKYEKFIIKYDPICLQFKSQQMESVMTDNNKKKKIVIDNSIFSIKSPCEWHQCIFIKLRFYTTINNEEYRNFIQINDNDGNDEIFSGVKKIDKDNNWLHKNVTSENINDYNEKDNFLMDTSRGKILNNTLMLLFNVIKDNIMIEYIKYIANH